MFSKISLSRMFSALLALSLTLAQATPTLAAPGDTTRVSVDSNGAQGVGSFSFTSGGRYVAISADGRYVAFESEATNLVIGDTNGKRDVFVHDLTTGATTRVSVGTGVGGAQGNGESFIPCPSISANGRYVAFESNASNLVAGDTNGMGDIFVRDTISNTTTRVSVDSGGAQGNSGSYTPSISADGRYVVFESSATNLVSGDTNLVSDTFVHDMTTGATTRVSVDSSGLERNGGPYSWSSLPSISADGQFVAFESNATNLVSGDTNGMRDVFVHNLTTGATTRVSVGTGISGAEGDNSSYTPSISADGRYVAFESYATNLVSGDTNGHADIFVRDTQTNITTLVSVSSSGAQGNDHSSYASISADGRYVAFGSSATNLVSGDTGIADIFLRDTQTNITTIVSVNSSGAQGNNSSLIPAISADGRFVAFPSFANNLVSGDTNGAWDIFVHENDFTPPSPVPAVVTSTNDSGAGSLREAIAGSGVGATITFDAALSGGTIYLGSTLTLTKDVTIDGSALASQITISGDSNNDGTGDVRVFNVANVTATLNSLIIAKGADAFGFPGGGIDNAGTLTVTNSTLSGNSTGSHGGGINNSGTLIVTNSTLSGNSAPGGFGGGGISNGGTLTLTNSTLSGNSATGGFGGGILNDGGTLIVTNSTLSVNSATWGGGISNKGTLTVTNSTFSGNSANDGSGIFNDTGGTLTVMNSTLSSNIASSWGGGIDNWGTLTVANSTLSGNSAGFGGGGGISNEEGTLTVTNSTLSGNFTVDGGIGGGIFNSVGTLNYANTIIANSPTGGDCVNHATVGTNTINLVEDGSCSASLNGDPKLGPLAHNGGSTQTFALLVGSSAIDVGNDLICSAAPVNGLDQRGVSRPQGAHCDIGAVEDTGTHIISSNTASGTNPSATTGGSTGITANATGSGTLTVGIFNANPGGTPSFSSRDAYVDVHVAPGNTFTSLTIVDCNLNGGTKVYWWNGTTWALASNQSYNPSTLCVTITVNNSTSPSLSQLTGTPFGAATDVSKLFLPLILR